MSYPHSVVVIAAPVAVTPAQPRAYAIVASSAGQQIDFGAPTDDGVAARLDEAENAAYAWLTSVARPARATAANITVARNGAAAPAAAIAVDRTTTEPVYGYSIVVRDVFGERATIADAGVALAVAPFVDAMTTYAVVYEHRTQFTPATWLRAERLDASQTELATFIVAPVGWSKPVAAAPAPEATSTTAAAAPEATVASVEAPAAPTLPAAQRTASMREVFSAQVSAEMLEGVAAREVRLSNDQPRMIQMSSAEANALSQQQ